MRVLDAIEAYLNSRDLAPSTRAGYRACLRSFLRWTREHNYFTIGTSSKYYESSLRKYSKLARSTIDYYTRIVRSFCKWYADNKNVDIYDMTTNFNNKGKFNAPSASITPNVLKFLCDAAKVRGEAGLRSRAMLLMAVVCSLNPKQIASIKPGDAFLGYEGAYVKVCSIDGMDTLEVELPGFVRDALADYLVERGSIDRNLPLVAVTTTKSNRQAMSAADVRKCLIKVLSFLEYDYCDVFNGDCERIIASYIGHLNSTEKQEVAAYVTRLYYSHQDIGW